MNGRLVRTPSDARGLKLIVHADDFGISEAVNGGVVEAHTKGVLTSASIMANGAAFEHAIDLCVSNPDLDVGVHLTLVEETPLSSLERVTSLVDEAGCFHRHVTVFAARYFQGKIDLGQVEAELEAQILKVRASGVAISHLDSHQHVHMLPGIRRVAVALARKYGVPCVRLPREAPRRYMFRRLGGAARLAQLAALNLFCDAGEKDFPLHADHFAGFFFGGALNTENWLTLIASLPASGSCELMCHPGQDDPNGPRSHWGYRWSQELLALCDSEVAAALRARGISLISYRDFARSAA